MSEHEKLKAICNKIDYKRGQLECWDCLRKRGLCYPGSKKGINGICSICGLKGKDIGLLIGDYNENVNVREIIFTQEFMDKFIGYRKNWKIKTTPTRSLIGTFYFGLMGDIEEKGHLDNPCDYLYNLIFNGEEKGK